MLRSMVLGAGLSLGLAGAAVAEPFETFVNHCLANDGRTAAVTESLSKGAWFALPPEMAAELKDPNIRSAMVFMNVDPANPEGSEVDELEVVVVGQGSEQMLPDLPEASAEFCAVMSFTADAAVLDQKLGRLLGFAKVEEDDEGGFWLFSRDGAGFRSEAGLVDVEDSEAEAILNTRHLYMAGASVDDDMASIFLASIRPRE